MPGLEQYAKYSHPQIPQSNLERWRRWGRYAVNVLFPNEAYVRGNASQELADLIANDYSVLMLYPHLTEDDQARLLSASYRLCPELISLPAYSPVAYHVYDRARPLADKFGITTRGIVTEDTVAKGLNVVDELDEQGHIVLGEDGNPRKIVLPQHFGEREYLTDAAPYLEKQGMVFLAPQGKRDRRLNPSNLRPVEFLLRRLKKDAKVAVVFVGLGFKRVANYDRADFSGLNIRRSFLVTFGPVLTRTQLAQQAQEHSMTIDQYCLYLLGENVPFKYNNLEGKSPDNHG